MQDPRGLRARFWERFTLEQLSPAEWEALCDGCGLCCLVKLIDEDDPQERVHRTCVACRLYDRDAMRCGDYANRRARVPECLVMTLERARSDAWLPETCAYRLRAEGKALEPWHPLVCGDREEVHRAGVSLRGRLLSEEEVAEDDLFLWVLGDAERSPSVQKGDI